MGTAPSCALAAAICALPIVALACAEPPPRSAEDVAPSASVAPASTSSAGAPSSGPTAQPMPSASSAPSADSTVGAVPLPSASASAAPPASPASPLRLRLSDAVYNAAIRDQGWLIIGRVERVDKGMKMESVRCTFAVRKTIPTKTDATATMSLRCDDDFQTKVGRTFVMAYSPGRELWSAPSSDAYVEVPRGKEDEAYKVNVDRIGPKKP